MLAARSFSLIVRPIDMPDDTSHVWHTLNTLKERVARTESRLLAHDSAVANMGLAIDNVKRGVVENEVAICEIERRLAQQAVRIADADARLRMLEDIINST